MKKLILGASIICSVFFSCKDYKPEVDRLNLERDSLIRLGGTKDSTVNSLLGDFNAIDASLDSINQLHTAITLDTKSNPEMNADVKERIRKNIENINRLLEENSKRISELSGRVKGSNVKLAQLEKMIAGLNAKVTERDSMIAGLNLQLGDANKAITDLKINIDTLNAVVAAKSQTIDEKVNMLHTAYYTMGTYKELRDKKVLSKQGGFLGIGKSQTLISDFDSTQFTKIDITQLNSVAIDKKVATIITNHPSNAYRFDKTKDKVVALNITDPNKFWSSSKYLVIVTK
ncbi:MAG TPA: hypothetical protein PKN75_05025 [Bacteroidia bacterium]|nr:hypothetical protein [Bacteroidia bacterium]HNU32935.1 hypothetical protein [Bacteroidia bacterium]